MSRHSDLAAGGEDLSFAALFDGPILDLGGSGVEPFGDRVDELIDTQQIRDGEVIAANYAVLSLD